MSRRRTWTLFGASLGAISTLAAVVGLGVIAGNGVAAQNGPYNTSPPTIHGTVEAGHTLKADPGTWTGVNPITYAYQWRRCDKNGNNCANIAGAKQRKYTLRSADIGDTVRVVVTASNKFGSRSATSEPSAVVAAPTAPANTSPPTISGAPQIGQTLTVSNGSWSGPGTITFSYQWLRCDNTGGGCAVITGATGKTYLSTSADVGHSLRARVTARNDNGSTAATTIPTAVIASKAGGCTIGATGTLNVADVDSPARLTVDRLQLSPSVLGRSTHTVVARFHVSACNGNSVQGALVYATGVPYNQLSNAPEVPTDATGWATVTFQTTGGYPASPHQQLLVMFVRARKAGDSVLGGISTRRLVSVPVR